MTLNTKIYVHDRVSHREVFLKCNQLIGATEGTRWTDSQDETWQAGSGWRARPVDPWTLMNEPDQELPGWLMLNYRPGAPLRAEAEGHDEDCDPDCEWQHEPACWLRLSLDTAYRYRDALGGCGDLHARFAGALGTWLDGQDIRWSWRNEFTGDIHQGAEGLGELGAAGAEARAWRAGTVLPAIGRALGT